MALEELKSRLDTMTAEFNQDALKAQNLLKAEEERKIRMSVLEAKIKSYESRSSFASPYIFFIIINQ